MTALAPGHCRTSGRADQDDRHRSLEELHQRALLAIGARHHPMAAPLLVTKRTAGLAERIRTSPVLMSWQWAQLTARALHGVELGAEVPPAYYGAAAEVIGYVLRLKGRR